MACPMGFGSGMKRPIAFEKPHIFEPIAEPKELKNFTNDAIYLTGGQFAILCQFAHPGLAEGSFKHSNFAYRIMNRLQTTARFLNACVYGTKAEKEAVFSVIHNKHGKPHSIGYNTRYIGALHELSLFRDTSANADVLQPKSKENPTSQTIRSYINGPPQRYLYP
jgi:uncharacterized protein (DUF2236 family)